MIWSTGTVKRIADGLTDKRSSRAKKVLPAGAVLWAWDADPDFDEKAGEQACHGDQQRVAGAACAGAHVAISCICDCVFSKVARTTPSSRGPAALPFLVQ
jgi:hypothetical protein